MVAGIGLEVLMGAGRNLGQAVVDLVGDPMAFLLLGYQEPADQVLEVALPLGELLVEPGVLDGQGRPVG